MFKHLNRRISTLIAITIIVISAVILIGGVFAYQYFAIRASNEIHNQADPTAGWKTYRNDKYGFEFKYPTAWSTSEESNQMGYKFGLFLQKNKYKIAVYIQDANYTEGLLEDNQVNNQFIKIKVSGEGALRNKNLECMEGCFFNVVFPSSYNDPKHIFAWKTKGTLESNGDYYSFSYLQPDLYNSNNNLIDWAIITEADKILSTFKFTNPTVDQTADWKTYTDQQYGFSFNYPPSLKIDVQGPNVAQQDLNAGKQISGTVTPSYETLYFRDSTNKAKFQIDVFHTTDKTLTVDNYKNYFYTSGTCDLRYLDAHPSIEIIQKNGISFIQVDAVGANNLPRSCFYLKNKSNNLIVLSMLAPDNKSDYDSTRGTAENVLSTFKFPK